MEFDNEYSVTNLMLKIQGRLSGPLSIVCVDPVNQLRMSTLFSTRFMEIYQFCLYPTVGEDCIYFCSSDPFPKSSNMSSVGSFCIVFFIFFSSRAKVWHSRRRANVFQNCLFLTFVFLTSYKILTLTEDICKKTQKRWKTEFDLMIVYE